AIIRVFPPFGPAAPSPRSRLPMERLPLPRVDVDADFWSLRFVEETCESLAVRKNVPQPLSLATDCGVMATVYAGGGYGYAAATGPARRLRVTVARRGPAGARRVVRVAAAGIAGGRLRSAHRRLGSAGRRAPCDAPAGDQRRR